MIPHSPCVGIAASSDSPAPGAAISPFWLAALRLTGRHRLAEK
jgi:hypothetical protein